MRSELQAAYAKRITTSLLKTLVHRHTCTRAHTHTACSRALKCSVHQRVQIYSHVQRGAHLVSFVLATRRLTIQVLMDTHTLSISLTGDMLT